MREVTEAEARMLYGVVSTIIGGTKGMVGNTQADLHREVECIISEETYVKLLQFLADKREQYGVM